MSKLTTTVMRILAASMPMAIAGIAGAQQAYPSKPIRFITPFAPGGSTTILARIIGQKLTESWGQQVLVENRPGGNTIIGTEAVAKSSADGYTILLASNNHAINPLLISKLPYDAIKDFAPVTTLGSSEYMLALHPSVPAKNLQEFIAFARSKPGQLNFSSSASGGPGHLAGELFNIMAGVKIQHVPYKGGGPSVTDLVGGQVQLSFVVPINVLAYVKAGRLKAIAIAGKTRLAALPKMPTFAEAGLANFEASNWFGVLAPAGTPKPIIDKLSIEIAKILTMPDIKEKLESQGIEPFFSTPEQFAERMRSDMIKFAQVIKAANIKPEN